jgi:V8-like Glu-specific endopeptidase
MAQQKSDESNHDNCKEVTMSIKMFNRLGLTIMLLAILAILTSLASPVGATQAPQQKQRTSARIAERADIRAARTMWTREARAAAEPYPAPEIDISALPEMGAEEVSGPPGFAPGGLPNPKADQSAQRAFPEEWKVEKALDLEDPGATGTAGVYTTYRGNTYVQMWRTFPWKATGKVYFTRWDGTNSYCSASVISPNNIIVTAAHCVYDTNANQWQDNWTFVPAERSGNAPYSTFPWIGARVLVAWQNASSYNAGIRYDVAVIRLGNNSVGQPVTNYTGWLGRSWNLGYVQNQTEIGYPSNLFGTCGTFAPFTYVSHSESFLATTDVLRYGSNLGCGASGSPLIRVYAPYQSGPNNYVNAVQSGSNNAQTPTANVAPRFSGANIVPLCNDEGC